jgi:hypothetical protein
VAGADGLTKAAGETCREAGSRGVECPGGVDGRSSSWSRWAVEAAGSRSNLGGQRGSGPLLPSLNEGSKYSLEEWRRRLARAIAERISEAHRQVRAAGLEFMGREAVLGQSFVQRARSYEEKRVLIPRVAASDPAIRRMLLRVQRGFRAAYHAAVKAWQEGVRDTLFPYGTWWMRVHHRAEVEPAEGFV